jgi:hypothetical protein
MYGIKWHQYFKKIISLRNCPFTLFLSKYSMPWYVSSHVPGMAVGARAVISKNMPQNRAGLNTWRKWKNRFFACLKGQDNGMILYVFYDVRSF